MAVAAPVRHQIDLYGAQWAFVHDTHTYTGFIGGLGSGKSTAGAVKAYVQHLPRQGLGLVVAPTFGMLRDATWRTALEVWAPILGRVVRHEMRVELTTGAEVLFRSADDPDRLRGPNCSWAWIDEGAQCHPDTWPVVIGRLREGGRVGRAWVTTTPKGFNWVHAVFVAQANADTALYRASTAANPFVEPAFVAGLRQQYASQFARQELEGEFVTLGAGLIRREWFRWVEQAPDGLRWVRAWDLAASTKETADYTASVRAAFGPDGTLYLADWVHGRWEWPDARRIILDTLQAEPGVEVGVERTAFQLAAVQDLLRDPATRGRALRGVAVDRDKLSRAQPWIARAEAGKVALVRGPGQLDFLAEAEAFPEGAHDDRIDVVSEAVAYLDLQAGGYDSW